jgi:hypothetical protein
LSRSCLRALASRGIRSAAVINRALMPAITARYAKAWAM